MEHGKEEFIGEHCTSFGIERQSFDRDFIVEKCDCGADFCSGYTITGRDSILKKLHRLILMLTTRF